MIKKLKHIIVAGLIVLGIGMTFVPQNSYAFVNVIADQCTSDPTSAICKDQNTTPASLISTIVNVLLFILGAISVVIIIIGGIMYASCCLLGVRHRPIRCHKVHEAVGYP